MLTRAARTVTALFKGLPEDEAARCMYVDCDLVVAPYAGYRRGSMVFCGEDHARRDQNEALI